MAVGRVYDGAVAAAMAGDPAIGVEDVVIPVVGECDDSWLSDARELAVEPADAGRALARRGARRPGRAGRRGRGHRDGAASASRAASARRAATAGGHVVGVLVLANFGAAGDLRVRRRPGRAGCSPPRRPRGPRAPAGSCIAVLATDAPLGRCRPRPPRPPRRARPRAHGLRRAPRQRRDLHGLLHRAGRRARTSRSTRCSPPPWTRRRRPCSTRSGTRRRPPGRAGRVVPRLPHDAVLALLREHRRLG